VPGTTVASTLKDAAAAKPAELLREWRVDLEEDEVEVPRGAWPDGAGRKTSISLHLDPSTREPRSEVHVAMIPTTRGYEVPAWLRYGGWNECPTDDEHVVMLRSWESRFGVEIAAVSPDTMELVHARPPSTRKALLDLAREQYYYCPDLVLQGLDTLDALAAHLEGSTVWWFWWD
jgi:hypothetical protein